MSYYWASILSAFLATTLLLAAHWSRRRAYGLWPMLGLSAGGLLAGVLLGFVLPVQQKAVLAFNLVYLGALLLFLLWQFTCWREWFWHVLLLVLAGAVWGRTPAVLSLTMTHVINTALLLNLASVVLAFTACMLLAWLLCQVLREMPAWRWWLLLGGALAVALPLSGKVVLALMKLQVLELSKANLSFAAKTTNLDTRVVYPLLAVVGVLWLVACARLLLPRWRACKAAPTLIARRLALADLRQMRVRLLAVAAIALAMLAAQWYWDDVASRPPALSQATRVEMQGDGTVRLTLAPLMDGNLHRFAWVADDGRLVRFFVVNRLQDRVAPAVVLDACLLCGDKGYVQQGDQIVCVGCGVYMFKPSIGKPGGCNPVPVENWKVVDGEIVIAKTGLEAGLQLFSTVLTIEVTDPVSGKKLTNTSAPHRYDYANKTYFFADEASLSAFRDDPEKYIAAPQAVPAASAASGADDTTNAPRQEGAAP